MEPNHQDLQYRLDSLAAENNRLSGVVQQQSMEQYRLKQQIATLEEALSQLKQENLDQKEELEELNEKLHLQEPLLKVGVNIRRRFLEKAKVKRGFGCAVESIVEAGNAAAHRGDLKADASLFILGYLRNISVEIPTSANAVYLNLCQELYRVNFPAAGQRAHLSYSEKGLEIHNLMAKVGSCSSWDLTTAAASMDNLLLQRFASLAKDCMRRCAAFRDVMTKEGVFKAIESCPEIEKNREEMRRIAEETVALSMGRRGRYQMGC
jgi:hypothetical protein